METGSPAIDRQSSQAFDRHAPQYEAVWDGLPLVRWLRARVLARLSHLVPESSDLLDLGCGPGTDALLLGDLGHRVLALDASAGMVGTAQGRGVDARQADLADPPDIGATCAFDGALSNFGALNCLSDLSPLGNWLRARLRPEAPLVAVVMAPRCVAEQLALLRRLHPRAALRGRVNGTVEVEGHPVRTRFLSAATLSQEMGMRVERVEALGLLMAPPRFSSRLPPWARWEPTLATLPLLREWGDHTLVVLRNSPHQSN